MSSWNLIGWAVIVVALGIAAFVAGVVVFAMGRILVIDYPAHRRTRGVAVAVGQLWARRAERYQIVHVSETGVVAEFYAGLSRVRFPKTHAEWARFVRDELLHLESHAIEVS